MAPTSNGRGWSGRYLARTLGIPLTFGLCWLVLEVACIAVRAPSFDPGATWRRLLWALPFHMGVFLLLGVALSLVVRRATSAVTLGWLSLGGATLAFLGPRVALGAYRLGGSIEGLVVGALTVLLIAALLGGLAVAGRLLPGSLRAAWPLAAWTGWGLFWVPFLRRAGSALVLRNPGEAGWLGLLDAAEIGAALLGIVVVLGLAALRRSAPAVAAALAVAACIAGPARGADLARPDVLILVVDTLRADTLREAGGTPELERLAAESIRFQRAYSPSNNTTRSMPGIFTSLSYEVVGERLPESVDTIVERLKAAGWSTHGISANPWVSNHYGYGQGFDALHDAVNAPDFLVSALLQILGALAPSLSYHAGLVAADAYYQPAVELRRRAVEILRRQPGPLLLYVHTMDVHGPYLPPKQFLEEGYRKEDFFSYFPFIHMDHQPILATEAFQAKIRNLLQRYRGELRYSDQEIGRLIQAYRDAGRWDETLVWFLSDHGECFGEHGYTGHTDNLLEPLVHVPLLLKLPRSFGIAPRDVEEPVSTFDILPTTASLLGLPGPEPSFGGDLAPLLRGSGPPPARAIVSSSAGSVYSAVQGPWKLHLSAKNGARRLHRLDEDPGEERDVAALHAETADGLEAAIRERIRREQAIDLGREAVEIDAQIRQQLESLGYAE